MTITTNNAKVDKQFSLAWRDAVKAFIVAVLSPVVPIVMQSIDAGSLVFDWKAIGTTAIGAAIAYLAKNYLTPTQTVIKGDMTKAQTPPSDTPKQ